jgi:hypothetical protein
MEHVPGDQGTVEDELQALGAILLVRASVGWWRESCVRTLLGEQLVGLALHAESEPFKYPGAVSNVYAQKLKNSDVDWDILGASYHMSKIARTYAKSSPELVESYRQSCVSWMRRGYRRAHRRYRGVQPYELSATFETIRSEVKLCFSLAPEIGDRFSIHFRRKPTFHAVIQRLPSVLSCDQHRT